MQNRGLGLLERLTLLGDYVQFVFRGMEHELDFSSTPPDAISTAKRQERHSQCSSTH
jgi:hypothetical protein